MLVWLDSKWGKFGQNNMCVQFMKTSSWSFLQDRVIIKLLSKHFFYVLGYVILL